MATSETITSDHASDDSSVFPLCQIDPGKCAIDSSAFLSQIDKILRSEELHGSDVLRRLLKFLAEKSVLGEADELKEYTIAIEALGKPTSYDPRHKSAVRILVGRLRQKLANYYQGEGQHDPILIDLPKGRFKLTCEFRGTSINAALQSSPALDTHENRSRVHHFKRSARVINAVAWLAVGIMIALAGETIVQRTLPAKAKTSSIPSPIGGDASVDEIWSPFLASNRPMIVAVGNPLFVALDVKKGIYYRDRALDTWGDVASSAQIRAIRAMLKSDDIEPIRYYTAFGEADAAFRIAKLLGSRLQNLSIVRATDLTIQEVAANSIVFVGAQNKYFSQQIRATPIEPPLQPVSEGIRNMHPVANEPELFVDRYSEAPSEEGYAYALVTLIPGPMGDNDVESFTSNRVAGYVAAVKAFTDPGFVRPLVAKLKEASKGQMPRYYQVLLMVQFKQEVPTEITYVLSRELHYTKKQ